MATRKGGAVHAKRRRRRAKGLTKGELNKLIDASCHPFFDANPTLVFVDGFLHGVVEQNPPLSIKKFLKYNLPKLVRQMENRRH